MEQFFSKLPMNNTKFKSETNLRKFEILCKEFIQNSHRYEQYTSFDTLPKELSPLSFIKNISEINLLITEKTISRYLMGKKNIDLFNELMMSILQDDPYMTGLPILIRVIECIKKKKYPILPGKGKLIFVSRFKRDFEIVERIRYPIKP